MAAAIGNQYAVGNCGGGRLKKFLSAEEMYSIGLKYIEERIQQEKPLTITGLYIALGIAKSTFLEYESGRYNTEDNVFSDLLKELKQRIEDYAEMRLFGNNPTGAIFALKNYGWKDVQTVENTGPNGGPLLVQNISAMSDDDLRKIAEIMERNQITGEIVDITPEE